MQGTHIYENCPIHPKEYLQVVCLQCETNSIACPLCIDLSHKNHSMISLKKFLADELPKLYRQIPDHKVLERVKDALKSGNRAVRDKLREGITKPLSQLFEKMRKRVGQQLNELEQIYRSEVDALHQQNNVVCGVGQKLYTLKNVSVLKKKIKKGQRIPETKVLVSTISQLCDKMELLVSQVTQDICEIIRGLRSFWQASKQLLLNSKRQFKVLNFTIKFMFSPSLKHKGLMIEINNWQGRKIINELYDRDSYHIGVVQPPLNPFKNQIQFKVEKSNNKCVWLGICDLKKIIDRRFLNCYKKGQGAYWVWQAGGKGGAQHFSSLLSDSVTLPWNFDPGDVVKIRLVYDKESRFVQFEKNGHKIYRAKMEKANVYCACVAMGAEQESVVIMDS